MKKHIIMSLLFTLLVASYEAKPVFAKKKRQLGTGPDKISDKGLPKYGIESLNAMERIRIEEELSAIARTAQQKLGLLADNKEKIIGSMVLAAFMSEETIWTFIKPYFGNSNTELVIALSVLGQHYNAEQTLNAIVNKLKANDQKKAKGLAMRLIDSVNQAATSFKEKEPLRFEIITKGKQKETLHKGVTIMATLAYKAGIRQTKTSPEEGVKPTQEQQEDNDRVKRLVALRDFLGFTKWHGQE